MDPITREEWYLNEIMKNTASGGGGGSSGGIFWVALTYDEDTGDYPANKSYNDIVGAVGSGLLPVFIAVEDNMGAIYQLHSYLHNDPDTYTVVLVGELEATATTATENLVFSTGK